MTSLKEQIDIFLRYQRLERNASAHTLDAYRSDLEQFMTWYIEQYDIDVSWEAVVREDIRGWLAALSERGLSKSSLTRKTASIRSFYKYMVRRGHLPKNPTVLMPSIKKGRHLPSIVTEHEVTHMLESLHETDEDGIILEKAVLELLYGSGIRVSELTSIQLGDIDLQKQLLRIVGKGRKERIVPIGSQATQAVVAWLSVRKRIVAESTAPSSNHLFLTRRGGKPYREFIYRIVKKNMVDLEVGQKSPHTLRHTFATHLVDHGADIRVVKELLGHSSLATTQIYTHTSKEHVRKAYIKAHPRAGDSNNDT